MSSLTRASSSRPEQAREKDSPFHVFNAAGRKELNLDLFDESVVESRCTCRRLESVGPTVTNVEHRTTEHRMAAARAMSSSTPQP